MKRSKVISVVIGVSLGIVASIAFYATSGSPLNIIEESSKNGKPNYVYTKEEIAKIPIIEKKVLKANSTYKSLTGSIIKEYGEKKSKVNLWIEQPDRFRVEYIPNLNEPSEVITAVNNGNEIQTKDKNSSIKKSKPLKPVENKKKSEENEIVPDYNGTYLPIGGINEIIHPEMFAQGAFRRGKLEILSDEEYIGRKVTPIQVKYQEAKLGDSQVFWIDNETGIVLKTVIYDKDKPVRSIYFESVNFSDKIDSKKFKLFTEE